MSDADKHSSLLLKNFQLQLKRFVKYDRVNVFVLFGSNGWDFWELGQDGLLILVQLIVVDTSFTTSKVCINVCREIG